MPDESSADALLDGLFALDTPQGPDSIAKAPKATEAPKDAARPVDPRPDATAAPSPSAIPDAPRAPEAKSPAPPSPEAKSPAPPSAEAKPPAPPSAEAKSPDAKPPAPPSPETKPPAPKATSPAPEAKAPAAVAREAAGSAAEADLAASMHAAPAGTTKPRPAHRPESPPATPPSSPKGGFVITYGIVAVALLVLGGLVYAKRAAVAELMLDTPSTSAPFVPSDPFPPHEAPIVLPPTADARAVATSPSVTTDATAPAPSLARDAGPTDAGPKSAIVDTSSAAAGHRIFVDGKVVGETPQRVEVPCGKRTIQLGKGAPVRTLDLACGKTTTVGDK